MQHLKEIVLPNYPLVLSLLKYRNVWVFWNQKKSGSNRCCPLNSSIYIYIYMHFCKACRGHPRTLPSMPRSCQASLHILGSHIKRACLATSSASQDLAKRQQAGGVFFDVGLLGPCKNACRGRRGRCKACRGRCQASLGVAKQAYTSQVPTHTHTHIYIYIKY